MRPALPSEQQAAAALTLAAPICPVVVVAAAARSDCPRCLQLPAISLLSRISNHLDLVRPQVKLQETDEARVSEHSSSVELFCGCHCCVWTSCAYRFRALLFVALMSHRA